MSPILDIATLIVNTLLLTLSLREWRQRGATKHPRRWVRALFWTLFLGGVLVNVALALSWGYYWLAATTS